MKNDAIIFGLSAMAVTLGLAACTQTAPIEQTEQTEPNVTLAPLIATVKPGASVTFTHDVPEGLSSGNTSAINVVINEGYPSGILTIVATTKPGLSLLGGELSAQFDMAERTTHTWDIDFLAEMDGVHYLNLMATVEPKNGLTEHRAHAIRIEVGDWKSVEDARKAAKPMQEQADGEMAIILEAEETIE